MRIFIDSYSRNITKETSTFLLYLNAMLTNTNVLFKYSIYIVVMVIQLCDRTYLIIRLVKYLGSFEIFVYLIAWHEEEINFG